MWFDEMVSVFPKSLHRDEREKNKGTGGGGGWGGGGGLSCETGEAWIYGAVFHLSDMSVSAVSYVMGGVRRQRRGDHPLPISLWLYVVLEHNCVGPQREPPVNLRAPEKVIRTSGPLAAPGASSASLLLEPARPPCSWSQLGLPAPGASSASLHQRRRPLAASTAATAPKCGLIRLAWVLFWIHTRVAFQKTVKLHDFHEQICQKVAVKVS